ncbi:MAG: hypothetical protein ABWZ98_06080, partial [Nakamurella sp.]
GPDSVETAVVRRITDGFTDEESAACQLLGGIEVPVAPDGRAVSGGAAGPAEPCPAVSVADDPAPGWLRVGS